MKFNRNSVEFDSNRSSLRCQHTSAKPRMLLLAVLELQVACIDALRAVATARPALPEALAAQETRSAACEMAVILPRRHSQGLRGIEEPSEALRRPNCALRTLQEAREGAPVSGRAPILPQVSFRQAAATAAG